MMMYETLEYIEAYFQQALSQEERAAFELRCEKDEAFAEEVAFYITARGATREALLAQKQKLWVEREAGEEVSTIKPVRRFPLKKWLPYAAAACLIFIIAGFFFLQASTPGRLADNYINDNYGRLYTTMDPSRDSMKSGMEAYNDKYYQRAISLFESVLRENPANSDAKTYAGLAYYKIQNYDKALQYFDELADMKGAHNVGDFLKAAALLQRNKSGDTEKAKQLLEKVRDENEDGSITAREMIAKWR